MKYLPGQSIQKMCYFILKTEALVVHLLPLSSTIVPTDWYRIGFKALVGFEFCWLIYAFDNVSCHRRTSNYWIASGEKTSVYRGTLGSPRSVLGPNEILKEQLSFCRHYLSSLVFVNLVGSTVGGISNCQKEFSNCGDSILAKFKNYQSYGAPERLLPS